MQEKLKILKSFLGFPRRTGEEYLFYCPSCEHHKRKLSVNLSKNCFKCWICEYRSSDLWKLVKRYGSHQDRNDWKVVSGRVEIEKFDDIFSEEVEEIFRPRLPPEHKFLATANCRQAKIAKKYLKERGVKTSDIYKWKIGFCPTGEYAERLIFPSFNAKGELNYFVSRTYLNGWPTYKNLGTRKELIFNELDIDWKDDVIIVEGVFDAIVAGKNAIPLLGSSLNTRTKLFAKIIEENPKLFVALDQDAMTKSLKIMEELLSYGIETHSIFLDEGDVGDLESEDFLALKEDAKLLTSNNFFEEKIRRML